MRRIPETQLTPFHEPVEQIVATSEPDRSAFDAVSFRVYLHVAYRRRWLALAVVAFGLLAAVVYNLRAPRIFEAQATLQIEADPNVLGLERPLVDQRDWMREFLPTQLGVLESRELAGMARDELKNSEKFNAASRRELPPVDDIVEGRTISPVNNTRLVNLAFRSTDPVTAAEIANALGRAYVKWNSRFKSSTTGEASDWLKRQVEEQRRLVQASEAALQRYREQNGADALRTLPTMSNAAVGERQNIVVQKLAELQSAVTRAREETIQKEAQYEQLAGIQSGAGALDTLPALATSPYIHTIKDELTGLQRQLAQASEKLGDRHPEIVRLKGAVQDAEARLQAEIGKQAAAIRNEYEAARARERGLVAALERQKSEVSDLNAKAVEYTAIEGEARANRQLLDNLVQRSRQITLARDLPSSSSGILDVAQVPAAPILPHKTRNVLMGLFGSSAFAVSLIFLLEFFNTRIISPDDVKRHLRIRVLGVAPRVKGGGPLLLGAGGAPAEFSELLHGVLTNLVFAREMAITRTVLVTSSEPGEGKTVSAANLAVLLARLKQRVLLIDADLRRPRLHEVFGVDVAPGLSDVLVGKTPADSIRKLKVPGLWLMPAGIATENPADLLGSVRFSDLVDSFRDQFDWVLLDSPPVLPVADACVIARVTSGVLLVVGSGQASRDLARATVERLDEVGARIVGALLNRAVLDRHGETYLPYYHRHYQYYPSQDDGVASRSVLIDTHPVNSADA